MIAFFVPGPAVGKQRPRIGRIGAHARMFTPAKTVGYEGLVAMQANLAMAGAELIEGPCKLALHIRCQIPASWSKRKQLSAAAGTLYPTTKPDADNVIKAICDALNGVVWKDDVQVVALTATKSYSTLPGVDVAVTPIQVEVTA